MLIVISGTDVSSPFDNSSIVRKNSDKGFYKGTFSNTVHSDKGNFFAAANFKINTRIKHFTFKTFANFERKIFYKKNVFYRFTLISETELGRFRRRSRTLFDLHMLNFLFTCLGTFCCGSTDFISCNKIFKFRNFAHLAIIFLLHSCKSCSFQIKIFCISRIITNKSFVFNLTNNIYNFIKEISVMRNRKNCAFIGHKIIFKPCKSLKIQMVGRLVQHKKIGAFKKKFCKSKSCSFSTGKSVNGSFRIKAAETHTGENGIYFNFDVVTVVSFIKILFVLIFRKKIMIFISSVLKNGHSVLKFTYTFFRFEHRFKNRAHFRNYGSTKSKSAILAEKTDFFTGSFCESSGLIFQISDNYIEKGGFSRSVFANKTNSVVIFNF